MLQVKLWSFKDCNEPWYEDAKEAKLNQDGYATSDGRREALFFLVAKRDRFGKEVPLAHALVEYCTHLFEFL